MRFLQKLSGSIFILLISLMAAAQDDNILSREIRAKKKRYTFHELVTEIRNQVHVEISYSNIVIDSNSAFKVNKSDKTVEDLLKKALNGKSVQFIERNGKILIIPVTAKTVIKNITISGFIKDTQSKEVLIGAYVIAPNHQTGTITNEYGFYSLTLPNGNNHLIYSYIGYKADTLLATINSSFRKDVLLEPANTLQEIKVTEKAKIESLGNHVHLTVNDINAQQALLGENDVMRSLQQLAGVQPTSDGTSGVIVRGGDPGQNLNLLDGVPLYFVDHFFGINSVYNTEALKAVDFHKGAFPSRFGGRISAIIDVHTRDGDMERIGGQFTMGLVKSSLNLEGPIIKNKASLMISGRRTWIDGLWRPFLKDKLGLDFYDLNIKANYIIDKNNRLYLSFYSGRDQIRAELDDLNMRARWNNTLASARWNRVVNPKLFLNTTLTISRYKYELKDVKTAFSDTQMVLLGNYNGISTTNDVALKLKANWYLNSQHSVQFGGGYSRAEFVPTSVVYTQPQSKDSSVAVPKFYANEITVFLEDEVSIHPKWKFRIGIHIANWFSNSYTYSSFQPRLYATWRMADRHTLYTSFSSMTQFLHMMSNNTYGLPTDFWVPSTANIKPEQSQSVTFGYAGKILKNLEYIAEIFYKDMQGVTAYTSGRDMFDNSENWQYKVVQGKGWSYGLELSAQKQTGAFYATLAYTLSWNWRRFEELNDGNKFPFRYDRRHIIKAGLTYRKNKKMDIGANWTYLSGEALTLPDQFYPDLDQNLLIDPATNIYSSNFTYYYSSWNNYRLPAIHRLDIGANFRRFRRKHYVRTWSVGVFNAYARPNIMFVNLNKTDTGFKLSGISLMNFIPYLSYKMNF